MKIWQCTTIIKVFNIKKFVCSFKIHGRHRSLRILTKLGIISVVIHCHRCRCRRHFCNVRLEPGDRESDLAHARKAWREGIKICRQKELAFGVKKSSFGVKKLSFAVKRLSFAVKKLSFAVKKLSFVVKRLSFAVKKLTFAVKKLTFCREEVQFCREEANFCRALH